MSDNIMYDLLDCVQAFVDDITALNHLCGIYVTTGYTKWVRPVGVENVKN